LLASEDFFTTANIEYQVNETGITTVTNIISIRNLSSNLYSESYLFEFNSIDPSNIRVYESGKKLEFEKEVSGDGLIIKINFGEKIIGEGKIRTFVVSYEEDNFAIKTGEVWEISIPKISDTKAFNYFSINLSVPESVGDEAYISPKPLEVVKENGRRIYNFDKEVLGINGITAGFGKFQIFSFNINYHLENSQRSLVEKEIAIPPDTSTQKVYYQKIDPIPKDVVVDKDGNWLAKYTLKANERLDVKVTGSVQIFAHPVKFLSHSVANLSLNTLPSKYWESDDPEIMFFAKELKSPKRIYDYVVNSLKYDFNRAKPEVERLGAKMALRYPDNAICMEFTDLFIALSRASGIPAREINGFAYTENPDVQPLSLVADVLHAWPEYYDENKGVWVPVDPTWESTSGIDYFNKLDLRHFAFVIHGQNSVEPYPPGSYKLGDNPQKDVHVTFGILPAFRNNSIQINPVFDTGIELFNQDLAFDIVNEGNSSQYNNTVEILFDDKVVVSKNITSIPPYGHVLVKTDLVYGLLAKDAPTSITVKVGKSEIVISSKKNKVLMYQVTTFFILFLVALVLIQSMLRKSN